MKRLLLVAICFLISCQESPQNEFISDNDVRLNGLIGGTSASEMKGVVRLGAFDVCTAALVGVNPPTVISARHCHELGVKSLHGHFPTSIFFENYPGYSFDLTTPITAGDIVVMIYPQSAINGMAISDKDLFTVAPPTLFSGSEISICGFGYEGDNISSPLGHLNCGKNKLVTENSPFEYLELKSKKISQRSADRIRNVEFIHEQLKKTLGKYGADTRYGVSRVKLINMPQNDIDLAAAGVMVHQGDSGGPWFVARPGQNPQLFAISSEGQLLVTGTSKIVVWGTSWRLDHPWSIALLERAVRKGADIKGLAELRLANKKASTK